MYGCFIGPAVAHAAVPEPWGSRRRSCCRAGRRMQCSCWLERLRRGPARLARRTLPSGQQTRGRFTAAVLLCIVNWQFRMSGTNMNKGQAKIVDMSPTWLMSDPHVSIQPIHYWTHLYGDLLPPCFSSLSRSHSKQQLFNAKTFSNFISHPKKG